MFFHCHHRRTTFPLTRKAEARAPRQTYSGMYVSCLDCGAEFKYDWTTMRIGEAITPGLQGASELRIGVSMKGYPSPLQKPVK